MGVGGNRIHLKDLSISGNNVGSNT